MSEPIILSPLEFPFAWLAFVVNWGSAALCVFFAFKLWRTTLAHWWLLIGAAFLLSIVSFVGRCVISGSAPLPHGMASPEVPLPASTANTFAFSRTVRVEYDFSIAGPLVAAALWWAYRSTTRITQDAAPNSAHGSEVHANNG